MLVSALILLTLVIIFLVKRWYGTERKPRIIALSMQVDDGPIVQGVSMSQLVRNDQIVHFAPVFEDAHGNVADAIGSTPVWSSSNPDIGELNVADNGLSATFMPNGKKGDTQIALLIDADPSEGVSELVGTADLTVLSGLAVVVKLQGVLAPKPTAPAPEPEPEVPAPTDAPAPAPTDAPAEAPAEQPGDLGGVPGAETEPVAEDVIEPAADAGGDAAADPVVDPDADKAV